MKKYLPILLVFFFLIFITSCQKNDSLIQNKPTSVNLKTNEEEIILQSLADAKLGSLEEQDLLESGFYKEIRALANDIEGLYLNVDIQPTYEQKYHKLRQNIRTRIDYVTSLASAHYNGVSGRIILARNIYVMMGYDAIVRYQHEFLWAKLGIFAANEVRNGMILSYLLRDILEGNNINFNLGGIPINEVLTKVPQILIEGQLDVFTDIGALDLLNKYGPQYLEDQTWLTQEARNGYHLQYLAQQALTSGNEEEFLDLQTAAAIQFGAHEQIYTLQPLWDKSVMIQFADLNKLILEKSNGKTSVFGDIFLGTNKYSEFIIGHLIKIPKNAYYLNDPTDRVEIAANGFNSLNKLRKASNWSVWIDQSQDNIGKLKGVYSAKGIRLN
jgi:hypothetical protein